jgi:hypothetical protein
MNAKQLAALNEKMIDLRDVEDVHVERMGNRFYVHINGVTVLRIYNAEKIRIRNVPHP